MKCTECGEPFDIQFKGKGLCPSCRIKAPIDRLLANICPIHKADEIMAVNTCPVCLMHVHKQACKEREQLRALLASFPGFDVETRIGDVWIENVRKVLPNSALKADKPA